MSFAAVHRKSSWSDCIQVAIMICQQVFSILALVILLLNFFSKKCFTIVYFFALAPRSAFGAAISDAVVRSSIVFCNSVAADRTPMAA